jgi:hypothetical protein
MRVAEGTRDCAKQLADDCAQRKNSRIIALVHCPRNNTKNKPGTNQDQKPRPKRTPCQFGLFQGGWGLFHYGPSAGPLGTGARAMRAAPPQGGSPLGGLGLCPPISARRAAALRLARGSPSRLAFPPDPATRCCARVRSPACRPCDVLAPARALNPRLKSPLFARGGNGDP